MANECTNQSVGIMLHAYELRSLTEAETSMFETHLLECDSCFRELQTFEKQSCLLLSDSGIRQLALPSSSAAATSESRWTRLWHLLWPRVPFVLKPAVIYAVAILSIISTFSILKTSAIVPVNVVRETQFFSPKRAADEPLFHKHLTNAVLMFDFVAAEAGKNYHLIMRFHDGTIVFEDAAFQASARDGIGALSLPTADMTVGKYHVTISDSQSDSSEAILEFFFIVED
jgi:hypothetical protein